MYLKGYRKIKITAEKNCKRPPNWLKMSNRLVFTWVKLIGFEESAKL